MRGSRQGLQAGRRGFTLVEVVVASVLIVLMFAAVFGVVSAGRRSESMASNYQAAMHIARATMEDLRQHSFGSNELKLGTTKLPRNRGSYVVSATDDPNTRDITVNIDWVEYNGEIQTVSLTTSFTKSLHK